MLFATAQHQWCTSQTGEFFVGYRARFQLSSSLGQPGTHQFQESLQSREGRVLLAFFVVRLGPSGLVTPAEEVPHRTPRPQLAAVEPGRLGRELAGALAPNSFHVSWVWRSFRSFHWLVWLFLKLAACSRCFLRKA